MSEIARRDKLPPPDRIQWSRHRKPRRRLRRLLLAAAVVLLLVAVAGAAAWWNSTRKTAAEPVRPPTVSQCPKATLQVAAAPEIAPVVQAAARTINPDGADCGPVAVTAREPAEVVDGAAPWPEVWIPSSTAWLRIAAVDGAAYGTTGEPLARTPVMLAAPTAITGLFAKGDQTSWAGLVAGAAGHKIPAVTMPDPLRSTVGLLSVYAVQRAMARTTPDAGIAQLRALTLRSRLKDAAADPATVLRKVAAQTEATGAVYDIGVFPTTEQQLTTYQRGGHAVELKGAYPADGLIEADYPFAVAKDTTHRELAEQLRSAISAAALTQAGFRTYAMPKSLTLPGRPDGVLGPALQWSQYRTLTFQVLLLIDGSGSMNTKFTDRARRSITKAALLRESGLNAAQLFGEDTSIGMWFFATPSPSSPAHHEAVTFGPITAAVGGHPRRDVLAATISRYRATDDAGTPLYRTVLDGQAAMRVKARPGTVTLVVVLTDGDDRESRFAMSHPTFLSRLAAQQDQARPVPIIAVGYGPDADMKALSDMATTTGGTAVAATNPADLPAAMAKAFLAAHTPR
ncbi:substrate-binding domain-containing protein [Micromonosporaceae bacterium Da 78-11]